MGGGWNPLNPVTGAQQQPDGVLLTMRSGVLGVQVCTDSILHVLYSPTSSFPQPRDYVLTKTSWPSPRWTIQSTDKDVTLATSRPKGWLTTLFHLPQSTKISKGRRVKRRTLRYINPQSKIR
jgi:hypothetical protein